MKKIFILAACLLIAHVAQGHLGETRAQVQKRLGKGMDEDDRPVKGAKTYKYIKLPYVIEVVYYKHTSQEERYLSLKADLSGGEINTILRNNSSGATWARSHELSGTTVPGVTEAVQCWTCIIDGKRLFATYQYNPESVTYELKVQTDEYKKASDAEYERTQNNKAARI